MGNRTLGIVLRPAAALSFLLGGLILGATSDIPVTRHLVWTLGLWVLGLPLLLRTAWGAVHGRFNADLVAALAVLGAMLLDQPFAGMIIILMQTGGEGLEHFAERRASAAVRELEAQAPRRAHRKAGNYLEDIPVQKIIVGDRLVVLPGEMVPCNAVVREGRSHVDASRLTGEPLPQAAAAGSLLLSGSINLESPLEIAASATAAESLYARIVELVRSAQASKAPLQRVADKYAVWFTPITLLVCLLAWVLTRDPMRVLAVLVVATPCPLILATPVAILGGIDRAARRNIIIRHGGALEALAAVDVAVFDKTGTLTVGRPVVAKLTPVAPWTEATLLQFTAAVEQGSGHLLARTLVEAAGAWGIELPPAFHVIERSGRGVEGEVEGSRVTVGSASFVREAAPRSAQVLDGLATEPATLRAYVAIDGHPAGTITWADQLRPNAAAMVARLREMGLNRTLLLSGDGPSSVENIAWRVGITETGADLLPEDKVRTVAALGAEGRKVLMVGDGTNDAPALSRAAVGLVIAAHGGGIAAEAADVVLLVDNLDRVPEAVDIGRRTMRIAKQSIITGLGLSGVAMVVAALGHLPPAIGALLQEGIDVAVILNALRTVGGPVGPRHPPAAPTIRLKAARQASSPAGASHVPEHPGPA